VTGDRTAEWHLDRRVTVALIVALILNAVATALLVPGLDSRVGENEKDIARNTRFIEQDRRELSGVASSLASMNATLAALVVEVGRLADRLDSHPGAN
jgi:septal ring factor EnvC (AmiA/AmiB activator)